MRKSTQRVNEGTSNEPLPSIPGSEKQVSKNKDDKEKDTLIENQQNLELEHHNK